MNFDIDYERAKAMAWRLQDFLKDKPDGKLSRSSSIEAVALMLGFPNRNTMAAMLGEARGLRASSAGMQARQEGWTAELISKPSGCAPRDIVMGTLTGVWTADPDLSAEIEACAAMLVEAGRAAAPEKSFSDAMHSDTQTGDNVMIAVEDRIARTYGAITAFLSVTGDMARGTDAEEEFREARRVRKDERSATALALVNLSLPRAEEMWADIGAAAKRKDPKTEHEEKLRRFLADEMEKCAGDLAAMARNMDQRSQPGRPFSVLVWDKDASGKDLHDHLAGRIAKELSKDPGRFRNLDMALSLFSVAYPDLKTGGSEHEAMAKALVQMAYSEAEQLFNSGRYGFPTPKG